MEEESSIGKIRKDCETIAKVQKYIDSMYTHFARISQGLTLLTDNINTILTKYLSKGEYNILDQFASITIMIRISATYLSKYGILKGKSIDSPQYFDAISGIKKDMVTKFVEIIMYTMIPFFPKNLNEKHKELFANYTSEYIKNKIKIFMTGDKEFFVIAICK